MNTVNPDAMLQGSSIWDGRWREERARSIGISPDELEAHYRRSTTLNINVLLEGVAEAIAFLASDRSSKTTGGTINVDGDLAAAYARRAPGACRTRGRIQW